MRPTQERLKELLDYSPETGLFRWRADRGGRRAGELAGCSKRTYIAISVDDHICRAHHLAWLWMTGEWPASFLDHRDLNKHNNAWSNLRPATKSQNQANTPASKANTSGIKGVSPYRAGESYGKPWQASITKDGKTRYLGHFATKEEAATAYLTAAKNLFGEFARAA